MKRIRTRGMFLVAALAAFATAASSASATPPAFVTRAEVGETAPHVRFHEEEVLNEAKGVSSVTLEAKVSKIKVMCKDKKATVEGEVTGPKITQQTIMQFKECSTSLGSCENGVPGKKEIKTEPLVGELGNISPGKPGLRFYNESGRGLPIATFTCDGGLLGVNTVDSVVAELSTAGSHEEVAEVKFEKKFEAKFAQAMGKQDLLELESGIPPAEQLSAEVIQTTGERYYEYPWTGSETGATIKIKCGSTEPEEGGAVLGKLVGHYYLEADDFAPHPYQLPGEPIEPVPTADQSTYYTYESIYEYEVAREIFAETEAEAARLLKKSTAYIPCYQLPSDEKAGLGLNLKIESAHKEDLGYTL